MKRASIVDTRPQFVKLLPLSCKPRGNDIALVKEKLDWQSTTDLIEGLIKTIAYFNETLNQLASNLKK